MSEGLKQRAATLAAAARRLNAQGGPIAARAPFFLGFPTDHRRGPDATQTAKALPAGAALILRDYDDPKRAERAAVLRRICGERGVIFLVGGDAVIARDVGADGVHLRADQLRTAGDRSGDLILSAACHTAEDLERAAVLGADVVLLGPAYATESHPGAPALGPSRFKSLAASGGVPVLAIGGVDETNASALAGAHVAGFAAISGFAPK